MSLLSIGQEDLKSLHSELHPVSDKWFSLGIQLQISFETLKSIQSDNRTTAECLLEMLTVWLKQIHPSHTWDILIDALESPPVGEMALADQLRAKYCPQIERAIHGYSPQGMYANANLEPRLLFQIFVSQLWKKNWSGKLIFFKAMRQILKQKPGFEAILVIMLLMLLIATVIVITPRAHARRG